MGYWLWVIGYCAAKPLFKVLSFAPLGESVTPSGMPSVSATSLLFKRGFAAVQSSKLMGYKL